MGSDNYFVLAGEITSPMRR